LPELSRNPTDRNPTVPAVGIDIGTTNMKVVLVGVGAGRVDVVAVAAAPTPQPAGLDRALRQLLQRTLARRPPPAVVGIASMAETGVPLDVSGRPLGNWVRWNSDSAGEADELARRLGRTELIAATGVRPSAKVPLVRWAGLRRRRESEWAAMSAWAGVADLAGLLLTGRLVTDHTLAGRTMAYRLPGAGEPVPEGFDPDLLAEVGLRPKQLPDVAPPGTITGRTRGEFADCGLAAGTPVIIAGHDHAVGAYGAGVRQPGAVADSLGTAEAIITVTATAPDPLAVARAGMSSVVTVGGRHRALLAGSPAAGAALQWWLEHEAAGQDPDELLAAVLRHHVGRAGRPSDLLVLPYPSGRPTPDPDPDARLQIRGRRPDHGPVELAHALLEGLCLHARWMLVEQARLTGLDPTSTTVTVLGAAVTAVPAWSRLKASVRPGPVRIVSTDEPVATGAAILAAANAGLVDPAPCLPARVESAPPAADYDRAFARFVAAATERKDEPG
jgi:sugar (pentulose or hexulose) kinase